MSDIFVSYAREDKARVRPIVAELERFGWSVFWDERIPGGTLWPDHIVEAIDNCRCMVVFWSELSVKREWVREEALRGKQKNILVPVSIDHVDPPFGFGLRQVVDLSGWNNDPAHPQFKKVLDDIASLLSFPPSRKPHEGEAAQAPISRYEEIVSLLENPATIAEALERASKEIPFIGSDRTLFEMKRTRYSAGMTDYERLNWIQEMKVFLARYISGR